jgi:hypothetical protein
MVNSMNSVNFISNNDNRSNTYKQLFYNKGDDITKLTATKLEMDKDKWFKEQRNNNY